MTFAEVYEATRRIPYGRVASYGLLAAIAGYPRGAHAVGFAMRCCHDPSVPCHRVVTKDGRLSDSFDLQGGNEAQRARLLKEGVEFLHDGRVDMARFSWRP
jgi:methylated-DNA-protein-cysteine methyltransferase-like protein